MHKVFISYHHRNDQYYKNKLLELNNSSNTFWDRSVGNGDIDEKLPPQTIRRKIRDEWLRQSTVTILLVGSETQYRKHVDWELKSSMINGSANKRSGILIIPLPNTRSSQTIYSRSFSSRSLFQTEFQEIPKTRSYLESVYPELPPRIIDNLLNPDVTIDIVPWYEIEYFPDRLEQLVSSAYTKRLSNEYDLSRKMRMNDTSPLNRSLGAGYLYST